MRYDFHTIEPKWQRYWDDNATFCVTEDTTRQALYVLDMFPYPSGAGLHVGHPLGYVASDVYAKFQRLRGYNVLHPMGFDSFGLPAEQFALQTGQHPRISTDENIHTFIRQLKSLGLGYDWTRQISTHDPRYYRWTQWIFLQIFQSWYNRQSQKAEPIDTLMAIFSQEGNIHHPFPNEKLSAQTCEQLRIGTVFSAQQWNTLPAQHQHSILMEYRLAYLCFGDVNWCEALGTVLANDEVIAGRSYRGGHPVVKRKMQQWNLRITEYADRLLAGLDTVDFSDAMKDIQRNWIGKSKGAQIVFHCGDVAIPIFTTRPDTIFGVSFLALAPEHPLALPLASPAQKDAVQAYIEQTKVRSDLERISDVKHVSGVPTGAFVTHPFTHKPIPIWISDYVLEGYGTGAIMGVPASDDRDQRFAAHFRLPTLPILCEQTGKLINSDFLNGLCGQTAIDAAILAVEKTNVGFAKTNTKIRDAGWSRQRYWGEPFPIVYDTNAQAQPMDAADLPLHLPDTTNFLPTQQGQGPLAQLPDWVNTPGGQRDTNTMPTHAGAAWYFLRYTDPHNTQAFADPKKLNYWGNVDVYVGGAEHAVSHLLYARLWTKILFDLGHVPFDEPFQKLINQGKIMGVSALIFREKGTNRFFSVHQKAAHNTDPIHIDIRFVRNQQVDIDALRGWAEPFKTAEFICEPNGTFLCQELTEKMSKSKFNVINPDEIIRSHGADTLRVYELFLGPLEQSKPWSTNNIEGAHRFVKKLWRLFHPDDGKVLSQAPPTRQEWKIVHFCLEKVTTDTARFSFNTAISALMVCVNELTALQCHKSEILRFVLLMCCPYAPHVCEELWEQLGETQSIFNARLPEVNRAYLTEDTKTYPISINGKLRAQISCPADMSESDIRQRALDHPNVQRWIGDRPIKKTVFVPGKIVNFIV